MFDFPNGKSTMTGEPFRELPSGKHTKNWKDPPFLMGKSTINGYFQ